MDHRIEEIDHQAYDDRHEDVRSHGASSTMRNSAAIVDTGQCGDHASLGPTEIDEPQIRLAGWSDFGLMIPAQNTTSLPSSRNDRRSTNSIATMPAMIFLGETPRSLVAKIIPSASNAGIDEDQHRDGAAHSAELTIEPKWLTILSPVSAKFTRARTLRPAPSADRERCRGSPPKCALPRSRRDLAAERATKFAAQVSCAHRHWLVVNGGRAQAQWASTAGMPANFRQANDDEAADVYKGPGMEKRAITQRHTVAGNLDRRFRKPGSTPTEAISSALRSFAHPA